MQSRETTRQIADRFGNLLTVVSKTLFPATGVDTEVAAAVAGKSIMVLSWDLPDDGSSCTLRWKSSNGVAAFPIKGTMPFTASRAGGQDRNIDGWCQTFLGESLVINLETSSRSITIDYCYLNEGTARAPGVVNLSDSEYTSAAGPSTTTITVNRTGGTDGTVGVHYATSNGTATAGVNYTAASGDLTFGPGVGSATFGVATITGGVSQLAFNVTISAPTNGATLGNTPAAQVLIPAL